ncbi:uncharacterized protein [Aristolochia californica]|uniref:uncharacterized protein n=1 Tax=Aristolochia californica TaxID=171875 RepID=UPI0035E2B24C
MKEYYDKGHKDVTYNPSDYVWLHLQPYHQHSIVGPRHKLSPQFFGPFSVIQGIGQVAYQLQLPPHSQLHNAFHVSLLKPFKCTTSPPPPFLPSMIEGWEVLIQWANTYEASATWEDLDTFRQAYLTFELEDKFFLQGE